MPKSGARNGAGRKARPTSTKCLSCKNYKEERGEFGTLLARWCALNYYPMQVGRVGGCKAHITKKESANA